MRHLTPRFLFAFFFITAACAFADPIPTYTANTGTVSFTHGLQSSEVSWVLSGPGFTSGASGPIVSLGFDVATVGQPFSFNAQLFDFESDENPRGTSVVAGQSYDAIYFGSGALGTGSTLIPNQPVTSGEQFIVSVPATLTGSYQSCAPVLNCYESSPNYPVSNPLNVDFDLSGTVTLTLKADFAGDPTLNLVSATFVSSPEPATLSILLFASAIAVLFYSLRKKLSTR